MKAENLKNWLIDLISGLVIHTNDILVEEQEDEMGILYIVKVHNDDAGKVIGKKGAIADAIRTVLRSAGRLADVRISMKIDSGSNYEIKEEER